MIVKCNACSVRYHLDDDVLGSKGRYVRCSTCKHVWYQDPPSPSPYTLVPIAHGQLIVSPATKSKYPPIRFFWVGLSLILVTCLGASGIILYQKNRLNSPLQGWSALLRVKHESEEEKIHIQHVTYRYTPHSVICKVDCVNTTKELVYIPLLFVEIRKERKVVQTIRYMPPKTPLLPGEEKSLYMELKNMPQQFSDIVVKLTQ
jgi:predicted Zn finger-like uncharacterized protein